MGGAGLPSVESMYDLHVMYQNGAGCKFKAILCFDESEL